jgi:ubiquitin C-terminal hydrolase
MCYFNSVVHCLASMLASTDQSTSISEPLQTIIQYITSNNPTTKDRLQSKVTSREIVSEFKTYFSAPLFPPKTHCDAFELLGKLIDQSSSTTSSTSSSSSSSIDCNSFRSATSIHSQLRCPDGQCTPPPNHTFEPVLNIHLDSLSRGTLRLLLDHITASEEIETYTTCADCNFKGPGFKRSTRFLSISQNLIINLNRRHASDNISSMRVRVDLVLDLSSYMVPPQPTGTHSFHLNSVVLHEKHGPDTGHYTCIVRQPNTTNWIYMNDDKISKLQGSIDSFLDSHMTLKACILFYQHT